MTRIKTVTEYLDHTFAFDLRSLAIFRIALGSLILSDLLFRLPTLQDMYTEQGFFTRDLSFEYFQSNLGDGWQQYVWSIYWLSDSFVFVVSLFTLAVIAAIFLIVGKWTKVATVASWLLLASLHIRNPLVTTSGDFLFKMMLFWSVFLPLGAKWSLDSKRTKITATAISSTATIGYIVQLFAIYFFPGIAKWNDVWFSGEAMSYVLRLDIYVREFGRMLLDYPGLLRVVDWVTLVTELFFVWTLFSPWKNDMFRLINMALFWAFHIGIALSLAIGLFPWICLVAWLPLLPSFVWCGQQKQSSLDSRFDWRLYSLPKLSMELFCVVSLVLIVVWNVSNIDHPATRSLRVPLVKQLVYQLGLNQHFQMFGDPPSENPWFVYEARLANGQQVDLFRNSAIDLTRPKPGLSAFPQFHWRKLHRNALHASNAFIRQKLLDYAVDEWNNEHDDVHQVVKARLLFFEEEIGPKYNEQNFHSRVWGSYSDQNASPGSLFEAIMKEDGVLPF